MSHRNARLTVHGRRLLATTWYAKELPDGHHGARVSFLDLDSRRYAREFDEAKRYGASVNAMVVSRCTRSNVSASSRSAAIPQALSAPGAMLGTIDIESSSTKA